MHKFEIFNSVFSDFNLPLPLFWNRGSMPHTRIVFLDFKQQSSYWFERNSPALRNQSWILVSSIFPFSESQTRNYSLLPLRLQPDKVSCFSFLSCRDGEKQRRRKDLMLFLNTAEGVAKRSCIFCSWGSLGRIFAHNGSRSSFGAGIALGH